MQHTHNGHLIEVFVEKCGSRWDWSVKAGDLPLRKNLGETAPTSNVAEREALESAKRELDRRPPARPS
jgi:hypothetical protein